MATGNHTIYEDASNRNGESALFWGVHRDPKNPNQPKSGNNEMGKILMRLRDILLANAAKAII